MRAKRRMKQAEQDSCTKQDPFIKQEDTVTLSDTLEEKNREGKSVVQSADARQSEPSEPYRTNGFDFLRFLMAACVILFHSLGNRDPLVRLTHSHMSLGSCAVDGFFIISGFLISKSWERSSSVPDYLRKRALRIVPGFVVASLLSTFVVGALGSKSLVGCYSWKTVRESLLSLCSLSLPPSPPTAFAGTPFHSVNAPLWTIQYEALCYLLVVVLGAVGLYRRRNAFLALVCLIWAGGLLQSRHTQTLPDSAPYLLRLLEGWPLCAIFFLSGACFYLFRDRITYSRGGAVLAFCVVAASVVTQRLPFLILPTVGTYLLLFAAFKTPKSLHAFAQRGDFSYGIYLYGWPVQALVLWYTHASLNPLIVFMVTFIFSVVMAVMSWYLIERPFLQLKRRPGQQ